MKQLIEWMKDVYYPAMYEDAIEKATELLETEREQIEGAASYGYTESPSEELRKEFGEQYYKDTYQ